MTADDMTGAWKLPKPGERSASLEAIVRRFLASDGLSGATLGEFVRDAEAALTAQPAAPDDAPSYELAVHAVEELHQLGYTVRDGLLYPPDTASLRGQSLAIAAESARLAKMLAAQPAAEARPVAWRYRYHTKGDWHLATRPTTKGKVSDIGFPNFEEQPLYAAPPARPVAPAGWLPIETAPRGSGEDGPNQVTHPDYVDPPKILLWTDEGAVVGYYDWYYHPGYGRGAEEGESTWRTHDGARTYGATHWMPLPPPPGASPAPPAPVAPVAPVALTEEEIARVVAAAERKFATREIAPSDYGRSFDRQLALEAIAEFCRLNGISAPSAEG